MATNFRHIFRSVDKRARYLAFKLSGDGDGKPKFTCPICLYHGPFRDLNAETGRRLHAQCPKCLALERHRIQHLVVEQVLQGLQTTTMRMLHFAPEPFFVDYFRRRFGKYESADLFMPDVDHKVDLQNLPFLDASYDFVFASHVLEHVSDDGKAIAGIRRILKPGGIAILPVPIVAAQTVEYPTPNPHEHYHVRAPGRDYFARYETYFRRVEQYVSDKMPAEYQLYIYEDRSKWPTAECPHRPAMSGERHIDVVPVCYV